MKTSFVVLMSLIICSIIYPQASLNSQYALSFGIADNFRLDKFNFDIAAKKILDENHQLRLFLSPSITSNNQEDKNNGSNYSQKNELLDYSLGVGADYLWILIKNDEINMFGGTGLIFSFGRYNKKISTVFNNGTYINSEISDPSTSIGIRGTLGVEWKVTNKIGIHSEYLFTGLYSWSKTENKNSINGTDKPIEILTSSAVGLTSGVLFGVSIYF
ncbi:MAG: hypothetical protein AB1695_06125 [Stygiobacter sp.]